jgi:hypothetical protein
MKKWALLLGALVATGTAVAVVALALRRRSGADGLEEISNLITDCKDRIQRLETDLQQLRPAHQPAA